MDLSSSISGSPRTRRRKHAEKLKKSMGKFRRASSLDMLFSRRTQFIADINKHREMMRTVNEQIENDIDHLPLSKKTQWFNPEGIHPLFLFFTRKAFSQMKMSANTFLHMLSFEMQHAIQEDRLFHYYLYCALVV